MYWVFMCKWKPLNLLWGCLYMQMWLCLHPCVCACVKHTPFQSASAWSLLLWELSSWCEKGGKSWETAAQNRASSLGERCVQRAHLAPVGSANTAHLPLQFYFHIISISKSLLATLAFGLDKRRVSEGVEGWKKGRKGGIKRREMSVYFMRYYRHRFFWHLRALILFCVIVSLFFTFI